MKNTHYFTLQFHGFTAGNNPKSSYLRLITPQHTFYTDKSFFDENVNFDLLKPGSQIFMGTHRLNDGSYWIDWITDGTITLNTAGARPALSLPFIRLFTSVTVFFVSASMMFTSGYLMMLLFFVVTMILLTYGLEDLHAVCLRTSPRVRELLKRLEQAKRGDTAFCKDIGCSLLTLPFPDVMPKGFSDFGPQLSEIKHQVTAVRGGEWTSYISDNSGIALVYVCQGRPLSLNWRMGDPTWRSQMNKILPFFYKVHAPFIGVGDHLLTIFNHHSNQAVGIYNYTDGSCYITNGNWYRSDQSVAAFYHSVLFIFAPCMLVIALLFGAGFALSAGEFHWNWHAIGRAIETLISVIFMCCGALLGASDLAIQLTRLCSKRVAYWLRLRKQLEKLRKERQRSGYVQEIW